MPAIKDRVKADAQARFATNRGEQADCAMYLENRAFQAGETLDLVTQKLTFDRPSFSVFVDEDPGMNWAHSCQYMIYDAQSGDHLRSVRAEFPPFLHGASPQLELFRTSRVFEAYARRRPLRVALQPAVLSAYRRIHPLPLGFSGGIRYAILFAGAANCRHVNDMEFLYRTLVDVYGFSKQNIFVLNYDGHLNWNPAGSWEPAQDLQHPIKYPVDGTAFRMTVNGTGTRAGFQGVIAQLATRIKSNDLLFIHTNNHGGWDSNKSDGFMSAWGGGVYYASDFANDLAALPHFRTLLMMMEPCHAGSFINPVKAKAVADRMVLQAAVPWNKSSAGGWFFDPWAEMWISAMAGVRGSGSALVTSPDDDQNERVSSFESYDFALGIDDPVMGESSAGISKQVYLATPLPKLKLRDDKLKLLDDRPKLKLRDDKIKNVDDLVVVPEVRIPRTPDPGPLVPGRPAAPFILATPHHSGSWARTYPEAHAATVADYEAGLRQYEEILHEMAAARAEGKLNEGELAQMLILEGEYQALLKEYRALINEG